MSQPNNGLGLGALAGGVVAASAAVGVLWTCLTGVLLHWIVIFAAWGMLYLIVTSGSNDKRKP